MLMFRFWHSEHTGSDKTLQVDLPMLDFAKSAQPWITADTLTPAPPARPFQRPRQNKAAIASQSPSVSATVKRPRSNDDALAIDNVSQPQKKLALAPMNGLAAVAAPLAVPVATPDAPASLSLFRTMDMGMTLERAKEAIEEHFSLEILLKHDEVRLINQELAKCQVALEQLRRCHLIPYPVTAPTPEQMLDIAGGSGPSLRPKLADNPPCWAPPFGVTDGPYARHYAKWLIPDPKFDGVQPELPVHGDGWRMRSGTEGRATRNNLNDHGFAPGKGRPSRGTSGQRLQALSSGYPLPKDKSGPCVLKRSDGQTVKLVCIDCHRENFSSTQGFINHCRIAHKRDFKSHEEAAVHCGHPIEATEAGCNAVAVEEKKYPGPHPSAPGPSGLVHPFTSTNGMAESEACFAVVRRIQQSMALCHQAKLPGSPSVPAPASAPSERSARRAAPKPTPDFAPSAASPNLSRLLQSRGFDGNLTAIIQDAKTKIDFDQLASPSDDDTEEQETIGTPEVGGLVRPLSSQGTTAMRVPARAVRAPAIPISRPSPSKRSRGHPMAYVTPVPTPMPHLAAESRREVAIDEDMLDVTQLSPNTAASNNAPSLVSDDGEYDDSADSDAASEMDMSIGAESLPDVDEIDTDDEHSSTRTLRHHGPTDSGTGTRVRLGKADEKHVDFVGSIAKEEEPRQCHGRGIDIDAIH
ncbi:hypothetical protein GGS20DRAFT_368879 [Poronia punctata]|nr:hypothetical protein GGS20DRAFT_368879 [Poronia punctata]